MVKTVWAILHAWSGTLTSEKMQRSNVRATRPARAGEAAGVRCFVYVISVRVCGQFRLSACRIEDIPGVTMTNRLQASIWLVGDLICYGKNQLDKASGRFGKKPKPIEYVILRPTVVGG